MKEFFTFILAVYICGLTLTPCVDREFCGQVQPGVQSATQSADSHDSHNDFCSPFCHCSCCHLSMEVGAPLVMASIAPQHQILSCTYITRVFSDFIVPVWEPPKA